VRREINKIAGDKITGKQVFILSVMSISMRNPGMVECGHVFCLRGYSNSSLWSFIFKRTIMKNSILLSVTLFILSSLFSSCAAIAGIFKAGMGFGIFMVVLVIAAIVMLIVKAGKK
jgi:hypothetical protein